ncbi:transposase family protein [Halomonas llamarensis]
MSSDLIPHLSLIKDSCADKNKPYPLEEILLLCICAVMSGADGWYQ